MTNFDPDCPHGHIHSITGNPMQLVCRDVKGEWPFLWLIERCNGEDEYPARGGRDGSLAFDHGRAINAPAPKMELEAWVNFYPDRSPCVHLTRKDADAWRGEQRIACLHVTGEEGDGL